MSVQEAKELLSQRIASCSASADNEDYAIRALTIKEAKLILAALESEPEPTEFERKPKMSRIWCDDQGESPGRYLYFTDLTPKGKGHSTREDALYEYIGFACENIDRLITLRDYKDKAIKRLRKKQKNQAKEINRLTAERDRYQKLHECELGICEQHCDVVIEIKAKNKSLTKQLMEHGEALTVLLTLRALYNLSPDMREPQVESAAKILMRQSEEGLRLAHARIREEYIKRLQTELADALDYEENDNASS